MSIFNQFEQRESINDPYWNFDESKHFRPNLDKGEFFKLTGFDFGWYVLEPISEYIKDVKGELKKGNTLSFGQKALFYWWYVDAQVANGGFTQFYYNGYGKYVPTIIKGLNHIGDNKMAGIVNRSYEIYLRENKKIKDARIGGLQEFSNLYKEIEEFEELDDEYYDLNEKTMKIIERYVRKNPNEFCVDENGQPFDKDYTGKCTITFDNGKIKEEFDLKNGVISGEFKTYYETGQIKSLNTYLSGEQVGEEKEWHENGNLKKTITIDTNTKERKKEYYYENGQMSKLEHTDANDERKGEYKEWYQNGHLKEQSTFIGNSERAGDWLEFYENGGKKLEAEFKNGEVLFRNYWNEQGEQLLKNGTGLYITEWVLFSRTTVCETEYKEYKRHGKSRCIREGKVTLEEEFQNGKEHGVTKFYDDEGNLKKEIVFENGVEKTRKEY